MNKQDLDALANLYGEVYYTQDVEQLNEIDLGLGGLTSAFGNTPEASKRRQEQVKKEKEQQAATRASTQRRDMGVVLRDGKYKTIYTKTPEALALADRLNKEEGRNKPKQTEQPTRTPVPGTQPAGSPSARPAGSSSTPPPRPATSSTVLAKRKGVEGKLDKATGKFTAGAFSDTEKSRYSSVAAQNAAKSSASSGAATPAAAQPKPATPAVGKLGNTSFERRTPTSAELRAAQGARDKGASPEKALQAAQKTNLPTTGPSHAIPDLKSVNTDLAKANSPAVINRPAPAGSALAKQQAQQKLKPPTPGTMTQSYEWPSAKTIRDIADAYSSIYEAKKVDQDQDGDNDFADVRIARMIASGMSRAEAIAAVKNKEYNEDFELWVNELLEEGYDLSDYTWDEMAEIYLDEATRMRKELGKEGEIATRQELARRSNAYQRSGSVDKTIAAAERGAKNPYVARGKNETEAEHNKRKQAKSQTLTRLASNRRGSVRDKPRAGLRGYAAKVEGSDRDLQSARGSARSAGTLTPREKKQLNMEAYEAYEFVVSYLLENNFAETLNDANVIIENMSDNWFTQIMEAPYTGRPVGREAMLSNNISRARPTPTTQTTPRPTSTSQGPGTLEKVGSTLGAKVGGFIGQNRGTSTGIPGAGTIGRVIGSNKGSNIGGTVGRAADKVVGSFSQSSSGGYSTREGDGKPYKDGPLWDGGGPKTSPKPPKPTSKPPMRDEPLF